MDKDVINAFDASCALDELSEELRSWFLLELRKSIPSSTDLGNKIKDLYKNYPEIDILDNDLVYESIRYVIESTLDELTTNYIKNVKFS